MAQGRGMCGREGRLWRGCCEADDDDSDWLRQAEAGVMTSPSTPNLRASEIS